VGAPEQAPGYVPGALEGAVRVYTESREALPELARNSGQGTVLAMQAWNTWELGQVHPGVAITH